jgi:hypothetical protein
MKRKRLRSIAHIDAPDGRCFWPRTCRSSLSCPGAAKTNARHHGVRLRQRRRRHGLRRCRDGQGEASNSDQPERSLLPPEVAFHDPIGQSSRRITASRSADGQRTALHAPCHCPRIGGFARIGGAEAKSLTHGVDAESSAISIGPCGSRTVIGRVSIIGSVSIIGVLDGGSGEAGTWSPGGS